jgi:hypothetical protein
LWIDAMAWLADGMVAVDDELWATLKALRGCGGAND